MRWKSVGSPLYWFWRWYDWEKESFRCVRYLVSYVCQVALVIVRFICGGFYSFQLVIIWVVYSGDTRFDRDNRMYLGLTLKLNEIAINRSFTNACACMFYNLVGTMKSPDTTIFLNEIWDIIINMSKSQAIRLNFEGDFLARFLS